MKLSSVGFLEGFYYKPRIDLETLEKHSGGLIASSACLAGEIPTLILQGRTKEATNVAGRMSEIFGEGNFFFELQDHGIPEQRTVNAALVTMASKLGIDLIATNDCHYLKKEDAFSHEVLLCIQTGKTLDDENRMRFSSDQFYLKTQAEMERVFPDFPDALHNTYRIFEMVDLELELNNPILPNFQVPESFTLDTYLRQLVLDGARMHFGQRIPDEVMARIADRVYDITVENNVPRVTAGTRTPDVETDGLSAVRLFMSLASRQMACAYPAGVSRLLGSWFPLPAGWKSPDGI